MSDPRRGEASMPRLGSMSPFSTRAGAASVVGTVAAADPAGTTRPLVSRSRSAIVHGSLVVFAIAIVAKAVQVQIVERDRWANEALRQHVNTVKVAPRRGSILDANNSILVESRDLVRLEIKPRALPITGKKSDSMRVVLPRVLRSIGVREALIRRVLDTSSSPVVIPGLFSPTQVEAILPIRAVVATKVSKRFFSAPKGIRALLGTLDDKQSGVSGVELELNETLRGETGSDELFRDPRGVRHASPALTSIDARPGQTIVLTLNKGLQEIAELALLRAMETTGSTGGDVVIMDPRDGAVLALAGARDGKEAAVSTPLTDPYEPGSVMKPFLVARLLDEKRATPDEMINTENGKWRVDKRVITDEHVAASMPLRDVIRLSSNIGVSKLSQRMTRREEYEMLRDFGFGSFTGVPYPVESRGGVPLPSSTFGKNPQTWMSVAMGYAMTATPLQIAVAYSAIANGGELLQPMMIREIQQPDGSVVSRQERRVLRRVMSEATARSLRTMLKSVVDSGTSKEAGLVMFDVAGKSGTALRVGAKGRYVAGGYNATFAEMFPEQSPQYVIVAKLIDPKNESHFGGVVSGAMVKSIVQNALATRDNSLDRTELAKFEKLPPKPVVKPLSEAAIAAAIRDSVRFDSLRAPAPKAAEAVPEVGHVVIALPFVSAVSTPKIDDDSVDATAVAAMQEVPSVFGLDSRQAVRTLLAAGFQVKIAPGNVGQTKPAAGAVAKRGSVVVVYTTR